MVLSLPLKFLLVLEGIIVKLHLQVQIQTVKAWFNMIRV